MWSDVALFGVDMSSRASSRTAKGLLVTIGIRVVSAHERLALVAPQTLDKMVESLEKCHRRPAVPTEHARVGIQQKRRGWYGRVCG
jgi:predicted thioesterase